MFITPLPLDKYGNIGYTDTVIEVKLEIDAWKDKVYTVLAPESFKRRWSSLMYPEDYIEVEGPARELTSEEWVQLVVNSNVDEKYKIMACARLRKRI